MGERGGCSQRSYRSNYKTKNDMCEIERETERERERERERQMER